MRRADRRTRRRGRELPDAEQPADGVQRGGDVPWLRVAVAGLLGLLLALRRVPVVARALTAPGTVNRLKLLALPITSVSALVRAPRTPRSATAPAHCRREIEE